MRSAKTKSRTDELFLEFEKHKNDLFNGYGRTNPPSHPIWKEIASELNNTFTPKYLYTIIHCNRYNIRCRLQPEENISALNTDSALTDIRSESCSDDDNLPTISFAITLSGQEWLQIHPQPKTYKNRTYMVLTPETWSSVVASHFWDHTKLNCTLSMKRAKVYENGSTYLNFFGSCKVCKSQLTGVLLNKPNENQRLIIPCTYVGNFHICNSTIKRPLRGRLRKDTAELLLNSRVVASNYRKRLANSLMHYGDCEPPILPKLSTLRNAKYEEHKKSLYDPDPLSAVHFLKYRVPFSNYIQDIGMDRFYVHYRSSGQLHVYNSYCKHAEYSTIAIDATGGIVKKLDRPDGQKSRALLLYDVAIHDNINKKQYSVANMVSERHDSDSICHWLSF